MISVCMATFNGERFIGAQIASILPQLGADDELVIADDSSSEGTVGIIQSLNDPRIRLFSGNSFRSPLRNFEFAIGRCRGDVIVLADQDDVWLPDKIALTVQKMKELESQQGTSTPLLVHTDLQVVDEQLEPLSDSLWRYQNTDPAAGVFLNRILSQNPVTGCTIMMNAALRDIALPIPQGAIMHDWWLALVAAAFGAIGNVPWATVLYRQHQANDTGAKKWGVEYALGQLEGQQAVMTRLYKQAGAFLDCYRVRLAPEQLEMLAAFASMGEAGAFERRRRILKYHFFYAGLLRNIGRFIIG